MEFDEYSAKTAFQRLDELEADYGRLLSHFEMRHILQLPERLSTHNVDADEALEQHNQFSWELLHRLDIFKIELSDRKMALKNKKGVGFLIIMPNEHAAHAVDIINKGMKKALGKSQHILSVTNVTMLTSSERTQHAEVNAKISALAEHMVESVDRLVAHEENRRLAKPD